MQVEIVLTPAEIARLPARDLRGATCVVFDVLRATSTLLTALSNGARRILPAATIDQAWALQRSRPPGVLLGGERHGVKITGFDFGNSPEEYRAEIVRDREIVMTTTNGTVALEACVAADAVFAGALLNLNALAVAILRRRPERLFLVCAGSGEEFSLEDGMAAAALLSRLDAPPPRSDAGQLLDALYRVKGDDPLAVLRSSSNGRRLAELGLAADVIYCAQTSILAVVGSLRDGALELAPAEV